MEAYSMHITGRVQGVGFRYFTLNGALKLGLEGWVKNMADGSVLVHVRGPVDKLDLFRAHVRKGPVFGRVDDLIETPLTAQHTTRFDGFQVAY